MSDAPEPAALVSILTTEHFTLQTARGATVSEANGRTSTFLGAVSGALVALSLLASTTKLGPAFAVTALLLGAVLLFLGVSTFHRLLESSAEDIYYGQGINRIRHYYLEYAPQLRPYIQQSDHDDAPSVMADMGLVSSRAQALFTGSSGVMVVTAALAAGLVGAAMALLKVSLWLDIAGALLALALCLWALWSHQGRYWAAFDRRSRPQFPAPAAQP